jgi:hypothetical protein
MIADSPEMHRRDRSSRGCLEEVKGEEVVRLIEAEAAGLLRCPTTWRRGLVP